MKVKNISKIVFKPITLEVTLHTLEEAQELYNICNYRPIHDLRNFHAYFIQEAIKESYPNIYSAENFENFTEKLKNHPAWVSN